MEAGVVSKGEFARIINVSPGRVSQYIAEGKLHGPAIDGIGRQARIVVDVARQQLKRSLDVGQMIGNGLLTRLDGASPPREPVPEDPAPAFKPSSDLVSDQIQIEKLREIRARNRRQEEEELQRRGALTPTASVQDGFRKVAGRVLNVMEGGLAAMASQISSTFQIPQRDVLHLLRLEFRKIRELGEAELRRDASALSPTLEMEGGSEAA